jgi:hypothetical protein
MGQVTRTQTQITPPWGQRDTLVCRWPVGGVDVFPSPRRTSGVEGVVMT